MGKSNTPTLDL